MAAPAVAAIPPFLTLDVGYVVRFTALDASTGNVVSGVNISGMGLGVSLEPLPPLDQTPSVVTGAYTSGGG